MKSCKAEVANPIGKGSRLGLLSVLTLMMLTLSVGRTLLADEIKLWHEDSKKEVLHSTVDDRSNASDWLWGQKPDYAKFVETFQNEPFKFIEGVKEAELEAIGKGKIADFKDKVTKGLLAEFPTDVKAGQKDSKVKARAFLYRKLIDALIGSKKESAYDAKKRLEGLDIDELLKKAGLQKKDLMEALGLTDKEPEKQDASTQQDPNTSADDAVAKRFEELNKKLDERDRAAQERLADIEKRTAEALAKAVATPPQPTQTAVKDVTTPQQTVTQPNKVGEVDDSALRAKAQEICDKLSAVKRSNDDAIDRLHQQQKNIQDQLAALSAASPKVQQGFNQNDDQPDLAATLAQVLNPKKDQQLFPQSNSQPFFPQQQTAATQPEPDVQQPFQQPQQPPPPQDQPGMPPFWFPPQQDSGTPTPVSLTGLPSTADFVDSLGDVQNTAEDNENPMLLANQLGPNAGLPDLIKSKWDIVGRLQTVKSARQTALDQQRELKTQLAELEKQGAEKLLSTGAKQKLDELKQAYESAKQQQQSSQQMMMMSSQNPQMRQQLPMMMMAAQQQVQRAKSALDQYQNAVNTAVENGNGQIRALKQMASQYTQAANKLKGEESTLTQKLNEMQQTISSTATLMQQQAAAQAQAANQPPQVYNVNGNNGNRVQNYNGSPRTQGPTRGGANVPSGPMRGNLGAMGPTAAGLGPSGLTQ